MPALQAVQRSTAGRAGARRFLHQLSVMLVWTLLFDPVAQAAPFLPNSDSQVLEQVPEALDSAGGVLRAMNRKLADDRKNLALALQVARLEIGLSRRLGDPRFLGRAEAALAPWPIGPPTPADVLLLRAVILQSNHDFAGSITALQRVVALKPGSAQAWLTLAAVHQAQAEYPSALHDCGQFADRTLGLAPDICTASVMALTGHAQLALRAMGISLSQNQAEARAQPAVAVWAITVQAETADRVGEPAAERYYQAALRLDATDPYLLAAWSDWLLDHDRPRDVIALLSGLTRIDPLLLRLALAERAIGDGQAATHIADLAARFETSRLRGETVHRREEARFALHLQQQPQRALQLAKANWTVQREPADARILLEAALAAGAPRDADPVRLWLRINAVEAPRLTALADGHIKPISGGKS